MRPLFYRLPPAYPRPTPRTCAEARLDLAIETILAARGQNYGEGPERALARLLALGPEWAVARCLIEASVGQTIRRSPVALLRRAGRAWAPTYPLALQVARAVGVAPRLTRA